MSHTIINALQRLDPPISLAIIGMGAMGRGLLYQSECTPGMRCVAIADINLERAIACAVAAKRPYRVVHDLPALHAALQRGELAVCEDGDLPARCDGAQVLIEASSAIREAGQFAVTALEHGKHLVLMNAEIDLIFGPALMHLAEQHGVVYTSCDGDQHGVIKRLYDEMVLWGFTPVMAGNIKGFLDRYANPTTIIREADKRRLDYRMATAYTDGTKLCVEMSLVANALGMRAPVPGMHGPRARQVQDVFSLFDFPALWASGGAVVDYILGAEPGGGVFVIGHCDDPYQQSMLEYYKMGDGPFYLFYRPYHLCHVEAMACVAEAALHGISLLQPSCGFRTNVFAYAKRDLRAGERLDGVGGYCCYGLIENCDPGGIDAGLPICLAEGATLRRNIGRDEQIQLCDVDGLDGRDDFALYQRACEISGRLMACGSAS